MFRHFKCSFVIYFYFYRTFSDKKLLFVCAAGYRSGLASEMAAAMGIDSSKLFNIDGGTQGWIENGHPTNSGPNP